MLSTLTLLAQHYRVYSLEMPGSGNSDRPEHVLTVPELADVLVEWLQAVGLSRATFLRNWLGCQVIVDLAVRHPNCIDRAILVSPTVDTQDRTLLRQLWRGARDLMREPWSLWPILASDYFTTGTRRILRTLRHALEDHIELKASRMKVPTPIVRGERDPIVPERWGNELAALLQVSEIVTIPSGTHAVNYSAPEELVCVTCEFLSRRPSSAV